eukprot:411695_1
MRQSVCMKTSKKKTSTICPLRFTFSFFKPDCIPMFTMNKFERPQIHTHQQQQSFNFITTQQPIFNLSSLLSNNQFNNQYTPICINPIQSSNNNVFINTNLNQQHFIFIVPTSNNNPTIIPISNNIHNRNQIITTNTATDQNIIQHKTINSRISSNYAINTVPNMDTPIATSMVKSSNTPIAISKSKNINTAKFACSTCGRVFKHKSNMVTHTKLHQPNCPKCEHCGKKFARKSNLLAHVRIHTNERPFKCSYRNCKKSFRQPHCLKDHLRSHSGEKPFQCEICLKKFSVKHNMVIHCRIHTGEKPYQCEICRKRYTSKSGLNSHRKHIHS